MEETPEEYIDNLVCVFMEVYRVLKPSGTLWLNIGDSYCVGKGYTRPTDKKHEYIKPKDLIGIPWMLAFALRREGWYLRQDIIWHKPNPMPESVKDRCTKAHEYIFLLTKSKNYFFDHKSVMEKAVYDGRKDTRMKGSHKYAQGVTGLSPQTFAARGHERWQIVDGQYMKNKRSVWTVNLKPFKGEHFATFPGALITDCIKAGCPANGIVLDPFFGSGTTGVVARKLDRNYIGFELNPEYVIISNDRINRELGIFR
jgi:DNA modification methylase